MERKQQTDIILNALGVVVAGLVGLGMFFLVGAHYGASALGVFNKVFAVYLVAAQISAFGLPVSVLRRLAPLRENAACRAALRGALWAAVPAIVGVSGALYLVAPLLGDLGLGAETAVGLRWAAVALPAFSCTKILLAGLNALARLRAYALCNALRYVLLCCGVLLHMAFDLAPRHLPATMLFAEGTLLVILVVFLRDVLFGPAARELGNEAAAHRAFGLRAFGGNLVQDLTGRVDVICLGVLASDADVGIYSMAALLAEAASQLPAVLRTVYNPKTMVLLAERDDAALAACIRRVRNWVWLGMGCAGIVAVALYPYVIPLITGRPEFTQGTAAFGLLMAGVAVGAGWTPFGNLPAGAGFPGTQSIIFLAAFLLNLCGNLLLIPFFGLIGAAVGNAAAQVLTALLLHRFARKTLGLAV